MAPTPPQTLFPNSVTYRRTTGSSATLNPPVVKNTVVDALTTTGSATLSIHIDMAGNGQLLSGDKFTIVGDVTVYTVGGTVQLTTTGSGASANTKFVNVPISPTLHQNAAKGAVVTFVFAADITVDAQIYRYPEALINGTSVMAGDIRVNIPCSEVTFTPGPNDKIFSGSNLGGPQAIVQYNQRFFNGTAMHWEFQCR